MFDFLGLKNTIAKFGSELVSMRSQVETLHRQREDIINAPATREDVKAMVEKWSIGKSSEYTERLQLRMHEFVTHPETLQDARRINQRMNLFGRSEAQGDTGMYACPEFSDMAICFIMGPALIKSLHAAIDAMDWPFGGISLADRGKKIKEIDEKLEKLLKQESSLVNAANEAGVRLD